MFRISTLTLLICLLAVAALAQNDAWLHGQWKAWRDLPGQSDFEYLELYANHKGYKADGGIVNGKETLTPYSLITVRKWTLTDDTLVLQSEPVWSTLESAYRTKTLKFAITETGENRFTAIFIDPDLPPVPADAPPEYQPLPLRFVRSD